MDNEFVDVDNTNDDELFEHYRFVVDRGQGLLRIDKFLMDRIENASRTKIQAAATQGNIVVNDQPVKSSYKVKPGDIIRIMMEEPVREIELIAQDIPLDIEYEDEELIVVNKPAGMVVHPAYGNYTGTLVNALIFHLNKSIPEGTEPHPGPFLVHRIDKDTSGLMIAAILAANMSSCSNFMVNLGSLFTRDIYQPYINPSATDEQSLKIGRLSSLVLTLLGVLFALIIKNVLSAFLFVETIAAFMGIALFGGMLWKRANRYGAMAAIAVAYCVYYALNYAETATLQLIYKWQPAPFGWAMLTGFVVLIAVSLCTPAENQDKINHFFNRMQHLSRADRTDNEPVDAASQGMEMILIDAPGWFTRKRWLHFMQRYREDAVGFALAWLFVGGLIGLAWIILKF